MKNIVSYGLIIFLSAICASLLFVKIKDYTEQKKKCYNACRDKHYIKFQIDRRNCICFEKSETIDSLF